MVDPNIECSWSLMELDANMSWDNPSRNSSISFKGKMSVEKKIYGRGEGKVFNQTFLNWQLFFVKYFTYSVGEGRRGGGHKPVKEISAFFFKMTSSLGQTLEDDLEDVAYSCLLQ